VWLNTSAGATDSTSPIKYRCPKCGSHRRSLYPPRGAEEERAGVNEMHTHRAIFEVNFAGAGPRWRLSDALACSFQSQRSRSKKGLAFGRKRSMCVDVRMR
jgi:hypothetical protein